MIFCIVLLTNTRADMTAIWQWDNKNSNQRLIKKKDQNNCPMLGAEALVWLANNREVYTRIWRLMSSAWDIKRKESHWWRHNGDHERPAPFLPLRCDRVTLCFAMGHIKWITWILKLQKRFRMWQISFENGLNSLPLVCYRGYGNLSTFNIAIPRLVFGRAWCCDAACG